MANNIVDLTFQRFGKLVAFHLGERSAEGRYSWRLRCDCGQIVERTSANLTVSQKKNMASHCGCSPILKTHGLSKDHKKLYDVWGSMKARCYRLTSKDYPNYGGRGISICDEWKNSFPNFFAWAIGSGYVAGVSTIERVDVNGNYEPSNCTWIVNERQALNTRKVRMLTLNGETMALSDWAVKLGIRPNTIKTRLRLGWSVEDALSLAAHSRGYSGEWKNGN